MTVTIPPEVAADIVAQARNTDGSDRALDVVATRHGLMLDELKRLLARPVKQIQVLRRCRSCQETKPLTTEHYYRQRKGPDGWMAQCIKCNNSRPPTQLRIVRNRARSRAYLALAQAHRQEFDALYQAELDKAWAEHIEVATAAGDRPDASTARLKRGRKREGQTVADRLDVARCPSCHTHHDAGHVCPGCGVVTTEPNQQEKP